MAFTAAAKAAEARDFEQTLAVIADHAGRYESLLSPMSDADFREEIVMFGNKTTARQVHRQSRALWLRRLPHAAVPVPQGMRARRVEHGQPLGWRRCACRGLRAGDAKPKSIAKNRMACRP